MYLDFQIKCLGFILTINFQLFDVNVPKNPDDTILKQIIFGRSPTKTFPATPYLDDSVDLASQEIEYGNPKGVFITGLIHILLWTVIYFLIVPWTLWAVCKCIFRKLRVKST